MNNKMSNLVKINAIQKEILADFMAAHTDLAKGAIPNSAQGKEIVNRLWETLTIQLNASGPPIKDSKSWRKVFSDQKQSVKRKFLFNKSSLMKTEGGPYKEKILNSVEEQILEAAGIAMAVDGLTKIPVDGSKTDLPPEGLQNSLSGVPPQDFNSSFLYVFDSDEDDSSLQQPEKKPKLQIPEMPLINKSSKTNLHENLKYTDEFYKLLFDKIDSLIKLKKKTVAIKEAEHNINMEIKRIELQIKIKELEKLN